MATARLKSPYPYFGGKAAIAPRFWQLLGDCPNLVIPFFGSGAELLARPDYDPQRHTETVNDVNAFIANFWRANTAEPERVAHYADWPTNENDLHARHAWLVGQKATMQARLEGDPDYYDVQIAGWWVWGMACWIGGGFCSGQGSWQVVNGQLVTGGDGRGVPRKRVHLGGNGQGVQRKRVHLGDNGQGVQRKRVHLGGTGIEGLRAWMQALSARFRRVRVCCGDWSRIVTPTVTWGEFGMTAVILDPPYGGAVGRDRTLYTHDSGTVAADVRQWCLDNGQHPLLRIVLCGYGAEHDALLAQGWQKETWQAYGGYGLQGNGPGRANRLREAYWISPHCLAVPQPTPLSLFPEED